nr:sugar ABC transporter substrate-binding protein [Geminicoccus roseus]
MGTMTAAVAQDQKVVGLAVANLQADFFNQIKQSVEAAGQEMGVEIITVDAKGDAAAQVNQIQDLLTRQVQALIYIPAGATAASVPVKAAKAAGVPVVTVDRNPADAPGDSFIATNSVEAAKDLAKHVCELTGGTGKLLVIQGQTGTTPELDRDQGFKEGLAENCPGVEEVARQASTMWAQDEGFNITQDMLQRYPDVNVIFGRADALALGAAQAVKVANLDHDVFIVGFDGDVAGLKAVQDGTLDATMTQRTQAMGRLALETALALIDGEEAPAEQLQPATLTTQENVGPFIEQHP